VCETAGEAQKPSLQPFFLGRLSVVDAGLSYGGMRLLLSVTLVAIAIILDLICQALILREVHPGAALLLGPVLISVPYSVSRTLVNRIASGRVQGLEANRPT